MPQPALKRKDIQRTVRLINVFLKSGHTPPGKRGQIGPSVLRAAGGEAERRKWCPVGAGYHYIHRRLRRAEELGIGPDYKLLKRSAAEGSGARRPQRTKPGHTKTKRDRLRVEFPRVAPGATPKTVRVLAIPDVHLCPSNPNIDRMEWMGRHAAETNPDWIIQLGDLLTLDSVNRHAAPGTLAFEQNPRILADFEVLARGLERFERAAHRCKARRMITKGNHEYRLDRFEDANPQCQGMFANRFDEAMNRRGWGVKEFGAYHFVEGVGFIHHALNGLGRPYGGKTAPARIANDSTFSIVHGHTHQRHSVAAPKMNGGLVRVISSGCAMDEGHIESYAQHSLTGWSYGVFDLTIRDGQIIDEAWTSMGTLRKRAAPGRSR